MLQQKYRKFRLISWTFVVCGPGASFAGVYRFLFMKPSFGTNIKTQLPQVDNGTILFMIGLLFFCVGVYRLVKPATSFKGEIESEKAMRDQFKKKRTE